MKARPLALLLALLCACGGGGTGGAPTGASSPPSASCAAGTPVTGPPSLALSVVATGLQAPLDVQAAPGDRERLFVVEQAGRIRVVRGGAIAATFLDITGRVASGGERGLLGLAFHPRYAQNGRFFVNYTDLNGDTHIAEFRGTAPEQADPASERLLLFVAQPFANHNGGGLAFGRDGFLYVGLGDGGSGGDPFGNAQNLATPLGKMLRLDPDAPAPHAAAGNPFPASPLVWASGLRNPWRFAFDRGSGDLYIGDVGQGQVEEIDVAPASSRGGENYGWNVMEGTRCFRPPSGCSSAGLTLPVLEYGHSEGCSVTGGRVYRGCRLPELAGTYFYGDFCRSFIRSFRFQGGRATDQRDWSASLSRGLEHLAAFGEDGDGELLVVSLRGTIYRVVPGS